jgi:hypothetical protein
MFIEILYGNRGLLTGYWTRFVRAPIAGYGINSIGGRILDLEHKIQKSAYEKAAYDLAKR